MCRAVFLQNSQKCSQDWRAIQEVLKKSPEISEASWGIEVLLNLAFCGEQLRLPDITRPRIFCSKWPPPILKLCVQVSMALSCLSRPIEAAERSYREVSRLRGNRAAAAAALSVDGMMLQGPKSRIHCTWGCLTVYSDLLEGTICYQSCGLISSLSWP